MNRLLCRKNSNTPRNDVFCGGFTLIELLIVITIIGILTVLTVSQFQTARKKANDVARKSDLNGVSKALMMYFADYSKFPAASLSGELSLPGGGSEWGGTFQDTASSPPYVYMKKLPKENWTPTYPYCYKVSADFKKFALFAQLESWSDKDCDRNGNGVNDDQTYSCNGIQYCYGVTSPNATLDNTGNLL